MSKNCKLQLVRLNAGPIPLSGKLRLVNEFNEASTYNVIPWYAQNPLRLGELFGRMYLLPDLIHRGLNIATGVASSGSAVQGTFACLLQMELQLLGTSKFKRATSHIEGTIIDEINITREEYDTIAGELPNKKKLYSLFFNNCLQQTSREFKAYKERFAERENFGQAEQFGFFAEALYP